MKLGAKSVDDLFTGRMLSWLPLTELIHLRRLEFEAAKLRGQRGRVRESMAAAAAAAAAIAENLMV